MAYRDLDVTERRQLADALKTVYVDTWQLEEDVLYGTGDRLFAEYVEKEGPRNKIITKTIDALNAAGVLPMYLQQVVRVRPAREELKDLFAATFEDVNFEFVNLALAKSGQHVPVSVTAQNSGVVVDKNRTTIAPGFQRFIRPHVTHLDPVLWMSKSNKMRQRLCRIEYDGGGQGTGFLVGKDVVLTNYHVVEGHINGAKTPDDITCRFDFFVAGDGQINQGKTVGLGAQKIIAYSPYAPDENSGDMHVAEQAVPTVNELDFALLHLDKAVGSEQVDAAFANNKTRRGWIDITGTVPQLTQEAPIMIYQHPSRADGRDTDLLKLAIDTSGFIEHSVPTRVRYKTNTEHGSSGSPCFDYEWQIFALHHFGDPARQKNPTFNQGVPIDLIYQALANKGLEGHLV